MSKKVLTVVLILGLSVAFLYSFLPLKEGYTQGGGVSTTSVVKAASTPPSIMDPALVVIISPNSAGAIADPCQYAVKSSIPINISSTGTITLVPLSGTLSVYVCGFSVTVNEVVTTANTIQFESGFGTNCLASPQVLTGTFGGGGITAGPPITLGYGNGTGTIFKTPAGTNLCYIVAGNTPQIQGVLSYVQQ